MRGGPGYLVLEGPGTLLTTSLGLLLVVVGCVLGLVASVPVCDGLG